VKGSATILVVDDVPQNVRLLEAVLEPRGYEVVTATDGLAALELVDSSRPDLVLLDVLMPGMDGYAVCRRIREREETAVLPVIMVTSSTGHEKRQAIEAGADDFVQKPFDQHELLTRVRSLLRIKRYHDTIKAQASELLELNHTLEERVRAQVQELERLQRLRRFLSPQVTDAIVSSGDDSILASHRREVAMLFADLRGWTSFVDAVEPEELMRVLGEFHETIGELVRRFDATVGFFEGDGVQLFFNDPIEIPDAALRAVRLGCALREEMAELTSRWRRRGHDLDFGGRDRPGVRDVRRDRLRGALGLRGDRRGDEPRVAARRRGNRRPGPDRSTALRRGRGRRRGGGRWRVPAEGIPPTGRGVRRRRGAEAGDRRSSNCERDVTAAVREVHPGTSRVRRTLSPARPQSAVVATGCVVRASNASMSASCRSVSPIESSPFSRQWRTNGSISNAKARPEESETI
jgi:adenylate cyclase